MTGEERRLKIVDSLKTAKTPISGMEFAKRYQVSRQVVVQDIALLRAANYDIYSTNRGYLMHEKQSCERTFVVTHTDEEMEDELNLIVDMGGIIVDVVVEHAVYGHLAAKLDISSRREVQEFMDGIHTGKSQPLKNLTSGTHRHTVEAPSEEVLDIIAKSLKQRGYLI